MYVQIYQKGILYLHSIVDYILQICTDQGSSFLYKPKIPDSKSVTAMPNYVRIQSFFFKYQIQRDGNTESSLRQLNRSVTSCRTEAVKKLLLTADSLPFFLSLSPVLRPKKSFREKNHEIRTW